MTQHTIPDRQDSARRHRRYRIQSRTYFGYAIGIGEGLGALLATLACMKLLTGGFDAVLTLGLLVGAVYAAASASFAVRFLSHPDLRQPFVLQSLLAWLGAVGAGLLVAMALSRAPEIDAGFWAWMAAGGVAVLALRLGIYLRIHYMMYNGRFQIEHVGVIGETEALARFNREAQIWRQGAQVVKTLALEKSLSEAEPAPETIASFARACVEAGCDHVLLVGDLRDMNALDAVVGPCREYALDVMFSPAARGSGDPHKLLDVVPIGPGNSLRVLSKPLDDTARLVKRALDMIGAGVGLLLLSPILVLVALLIRLDSPGPILFRQERRGFNGRIFHILKFRTMNVMEDGRSMRQAVKNDPRITRVGAVLRRTNLDELPQLVNVLRGEMSLVGPRPHAVSHDAELARKFAQYAQRQRIKPGITGWAQVNGYRGDTSTQEQIEGRTLHDLYYVENWSALLDIWIMVLTVFSRRGRHNAY